MNVVPRSTMNTNGGTDTSELILCSTICVHSATRHADIHIDSKQSDKAVSVGLSADPLSYVHSRERNLESLIAWIVVPVRFKQPLSKRPPSFAQACIQSANSVFGRKKFRGSDWSAKRNPAYIYITYIEDITRWREDMNFMFEWQEQYLTSERSERMKYCSCHGNIKFISSS